MRVIDFAHDMVLPMENSGIAEVADVEVDEERTLDDRFRFVGTAFREAIEALRETHDELAPAAANLDDLSLAITEAFGSREPSADDHKLLIPAFSEDLPETGLSARDLLKRVWDAVGDEDWGPAFAFRFMERASRPRREPIFHNSMLISVVAAFEHHLSKLASEYYRATPAALHDVPRDAQKEFSLRELQQLNSIDEAIEHAIETRVEKLMYGSLADWRKFFGDRMKLDMAEIVHSWDSIQEIFERRHCLVHNNGRASRRYVSTVKSGSRGDEVDTDLDYVRKATDALELLGVVLHAGVWSKFAEDPKNTIDFLERNAFQALKDGRWAFSFALYARWQSLPLTAEEKLMGQVNLWIARKGLSGSVSIRQEVAEWDVSGSDEIYRFAKHCLLEETDEAFSMVPMLIEREKLDGRDLATWPLTEVLRNDRRIQEFENIMRGFLNEESQATELTEDGLTRPEPRAGAPEDRGDRPREPSLSASGEWDQVLVQPLGDGAESKPGTSPMGGASDDDGVLT